MPNFCTAPSCTQKNLQLDLAFFRFLQDLARCQKWVETCRRAELEDKTPDHNKRLRAKHFETSIICRTSSYKCVGRDNAVPTTFDFIGYLNNPHSRHRKRRKELSEDEIRTLNGKQMMKLLNRNKNIKKPVTAMLRAPVQKGELPLTLQEKENKEYLKSLFEILILKGKQNMPLDGLEADELPEGLFTPDIFCSKAQQKQVEICESCTGEDTPRDVRDSRFFSRITDDVVDITGEGYLLVLGRVVDESHNLAEESVGFLSYESNAEISAVKFHTPITEKWGLNMEYCRGQAYVVSSGWSSKMKVVTSRLLEKYPQAVYTLCSSCALNMWLAKSVPVMGGSVALGTIEEVCSFFQRSPQLLLELDDVISVLFPNSEGLRTEGNLPFSVDKRHDAFEVLVDLLQALILCLDGTNRDTIVKWNNCIAGRALVLCSIVTDFDFIVNIVVLKNLLSFTRAFGKNLQGQTSDLFFAANSLTAVLHSLNEGMENIEVYHEFWLEEAPNLVTKLDIQMKLPGKFHRAQQGILEPQPTFGSYYKETLRFPTGEHILQELKDTFSEQRLRALKCLSLEPSVMGDTTLTCAEPDTLSAELHCQRIKWKHRGKDLELPPTMSEALHLPDVKFFPNGCALLKVLRILPVMKAENAHYHYLRDSLTDQRSSNLALLNITFDIQHDLDLMVDTYIKLCTT
uniref:THAP-type domain-containing protein n=1 Tax=Otolemur garnettii TaxID=30611 RepID=H0XW49_OTOGA